ncbi:Oligopeptide-binding protein AppA [Candidatus Methanoperedenaceae archaeon GB37]|nr:Oligopeptide-binding protein AppA [Candidatus Methanoperedenaceae archaeon GB37]
MWAYNPHVRRYFYNPEKAKKLLAEVGWQDTDGDGILDKDGHPFMFTIITNQGNSNRLNAAQIIQYRLGQIGIKVKIRVIEWTAFIKEFINKRRFEATILGWTIPQDPDLYDVWHSSKDVPGGLNFIGYHNKELDKLIEEGRHTFDLEKRKRCYFRIQEILAEEQPYTFLYVPEALPIIHLRFHGIEPAPAGISYNFIRWYVPKKMQRYSFIP